MKTHKNRLIAVVLAVGWTVAAGAAHAQATQPVEESDALSGLTPSLDLRVRYEFRDIEPNEASNALTARARAGLKVGDFGGFSFFGELEGNIALVDDYQAGGGADPVNPGNTPINDPENFELNRAWVQYAANGFLGKAGRQRIIRNNAAMVGNVGWRQNEQTFDAASLAFSKDDFNVFYAYSNRVQRIFGSDATGAAKEFEGDIHLIDGSTKTGFGQGGGYIYLVDVDNNANVGESNSFGAWVVSGPLRAELAWQDGTTALGGTGDYDALYGHFSYTRKVDASTYGAGLEYLENRFKTPLATVHAFNGFADAFALQRIGLNDMGGAYQGLTDIYASYARAGVLGGSTFKGIVHYFLDDGFGNSYGWEVDAVLSRKFGDRLTGLVKAAYFVERDGVAGYQDIAQLSVQLDYKF